jgi:uncharacterized protein YndB with AHSA1/START domain
VRLLHSARSSATPAQVWRLLGDPRRWPEFEVWLHKVPGAPARLAAGQRLMGRVRMSVVRIPMDVVEVVHGQRLVLLVHVAPGVRHQVTTELTPTVDGGCDLRVSVVVDGPLARPAALPLWLSSGLTVRVLAARADAQARQDRRTGAA